MGKIIYWVLLIALIVITMGINANHTHNMVYIHSLILITIMVVISMVSFIAILYCVMAFIFDLRIFHVSSVFSLILLIAVLVGIMLSNFLGWFQHHYHYHMTSLTIMEYYIQWSLIYTTIYQVIFNDLSKSSKYMLKIVAESKIINPDYIIMALFPALISTWIAIVIYKVQQKQI